MFVVLDLFCFFAASLLQRPQQTSYWKPSSCSHSSDALNYSIGCWYFSTKLPFISCWTVQFNSLRGRYGDVLIWTVGRDNESLPSIWVAARAKTGGRAVCCQTVRGIISVLYTTLRLASCSFRALSSSLLARTASSVFFLLSRLTFSSVSGALLFR